jgi:SAM-dependent methyltransferase
MRNEVDRFGRSAPDLADFIACQPVGSELLFVDDGSSDETAAVVERFLHEHPAVCARLIRQRPMGKGAAVRAGLAAATTELAGYCDVDLATPLAELGRIVDAAAKAPVLAVGSRDLATSRITRHESSARELLGKLYNRGVQLTLVPGIVDTQCGAKAARIEIWRQILPLCRELGFAWDVEAIALARALGISVREIGIEWHHQDGSQIKPVADGVAMLRALPRIRRNLTDTMRDRSGHGRGVGPFDGDHAAALARADATHWWFRSLAALVSWAIRRHGSLSGWLVDIGAGTAGVTSMLGWAPDRTLALERRSALVERARSLHPLELVQAEPAHLPLADGSASVVCLLNLVEHLPDPGPSLDEARRLLAPDGILVVTVPADPRLWSSADEVLGRVRRFTQLGLCSELERHDLHVEWISGVFSWLYGPVWVKRRLRPASEPQLGLDISSLTLDRVSLLLTRAEWAMASQRPLRLGTSLLCVARPANARSYRVERNAAEAAL